MMAATEAEMAAEIIERLKGLACPANVAGMARFGISSHNTLGVGIPALRMIAKETGKSQTIAGLLWESGIHEARILSSLLGDVSISSSDMDLWVSDFDSWDLCDQCCNNLFVYSKFAWQKIGLWVPDQREFVRRAGFVMMSVLAVHDKKTENEVFLEYCFPLIAEYSDDGRNYVKKAINWALRQIGKRNPVLRKEALDLARELILREDKSSVWIARDAIKELQSDGLYQRNI